MKPQGSLVHLQNIVEQKKKLHIQISVVAFVTKLPASHYRIMYHMSLHRHGYILRLTYKLFMSLLNNKGSVKRIGCLYSWGRMGWHERLRGILAAHRGTMLRDEV